MAASKRSTRKTSKNVSMNGRVTGRVFFVLAERDIGSKIRRGDHVKIDPDARRFKGRYVLTGSGNLVPWRGQRLVHGVAVSLQRVLDRYL